MKIERVEEFKVSKAVHRAIHGLLTQSFQEYPLGRIYFKQVPDFRYLVWKKDLLVGHMAVEYRVINVADNIVHIFGIADVCVREAFQSKKVASTLLAKLEKLAKKGAVDFLVLIADKHGLYQKNGFELVNNTCRWLIVNQQKTLGIAQRKFNDCLMVKAVRGQSWKDGVVDFLGPIF